MSILVLKSDVLRYILYANGIAKNYTERVVHTVCIGENLHFLSKNNNENPAFRLRRVKVNRVRANGEGMGCTQRELQQPCSSGPKVLRQITILT